MESKQTPIEQWKDVVGYEGLYRISNLGRVLNLKYGEKIIKNCTKKKDGITRLAVHLIKNKKSKQFYVNRLVASHFLVDKIFDDLFDDLIVVHIDGDATNPIATNLKFSFPKGCYSSPNREIRTKSGYKGVEETPSGMFQARVWNGITKKKEFLGNYTTAREANDVCEKRRLELCQFRRNIKSLTQEEINKINDILGKDDCKFSSYHQIEYQLFGRYNACCSGYKIIEINEYLKSIGIDISLNQL